MHDEHHDAPIAFRAAGAPESEVQPRGVTNSRGALVLAKLREQLGDDAFWEMLRRYVRERAGKGARTADLQAAGPGDLTPFFARWIYTSAMP